MNEIVEHITNVPDFPKPGIQFKDITTLLEHPIAFSEAMEAMDTLASTTERFDKVMCPESRGFLFGPMIALRHNAGVVLARKPGKLPRPGPQVSYTLEYGEAALEVSAGSIERGDRVLIVDDLLATGGSARAMGKIVGMMGGRVVGFTFLINLAELGAGKALTKEFGVPVRSVVSYNCSKNDWVEVDTSGLVEEDQLRFNALSDMQVLEVCDNTLLCEWEMDFTKKKVEIPKEYVRNVYLDRRVGMKRRFYY